MPVPVQVVKAEPVQVWKSFSARMEPLDFAEIRPQVSGTISEIRFEDGQDVEKGDILYVIDPRPYEAAVNRATAQLNVAKNQASLAQKEYDRAQTLIKTDAISKRTFDERRSAANVAHASVKSAEAAVEQAQIDLDHAYIVAPISGRTGRVEIKLGNLVEAGPNAPVLTTIVSTEGIFADFEVDEQTYLDQVRVSARSREAEQAVPVRLSMRGQVYNGKIFTFDNQIDASSGTIRARAFFENKEGVLVPGMFSTIEMGGSKAFDHILITERAIGTDQDRKFVYIVDENNIVQYREVKIGESINGKRIITSGLKSGDRVITDGLIRIRPNMPVDPQINKS
ncbi:MAG: efflux RND transporter periplasmic adaptor subunit [Alphaproteobacteria bacterium]|nr:efflux RND transporter periplasmic adaptor subunit [Alphaproteobacteria bacterium]